jgi:beta-mannosidase
VTAAAETGGAPAGLLELGSEWECVGLPAGSAADPGGLDGLSPPWFPARAPGTAAGALRAAGRPVHEEELDALDWWFRCRFTAPAGQWLLELGGVATVADVWLDGGHLGHHENMYRVWRLPVTLDAGDHELVVRCAALPPVLAPRRPRPRWKTYLVDHQNLRWIRTSLLGRIPGWAVVPPVVGPWRPVRLLSLPAAGPDEVTLRADCDAEGGGGTVTASFVLRGRQEVTGATLRVAGVEAVCTARSDGGDLVVEGSVHLPSVDRWWPHTHGGQPRYEVRVDVDGIEHLLGRVGFRTLAVDRKDGSFRLFVNDVPVFCRGACWMPVDPVALVSPDDVLDHRLGLARAAHMNMLRVPGTTTYEDHRFFDRCDELGIMVWHDCMFAFMDPPDDEAFTADVEAELAEALGPMGGHPSLAVVCGNQEVEEIASMNGLPPERTATPLFDTTVAKTVERVLPGVPYVTSNPSGGSRPFRMDTGVSQYFGVGGYLRPLEDPRRSQVRFAAECLALATPPEPDTVDEVCGGAYRAGHDPTWKRGVHHDSGRSWDMEDVRDHYLAALFGVDPRMERYVDAERALELGRAVNAELMRSVFTEWRRPGSVSGGGLVLSFADLRAGGAGWGLVDSLGWPKAPWYALRRAFAPVAVLAVDEGLNGLALHVVNDTAGPVRGTVVVELVARGELVVERGEVEVEVGPRGSSTVDAEDVLGGFRDITYAYRFSPPAHDAVVASLYAEDGGVWSQTVYFPLGQGRPREADVGLTAAARPDGPGRWVLEVGAARLAQWVTVRAEGFVPDDSWFHLPPGASRTVVLTGSREGPPRGSVQALNAMARATIKVADQES